MCYQCSAKNGRVCPCGHTGCMVKVVLALATALDEGTGTPSSVYTNMGGAKMLIIRLPPGDPVIQEPGIRGVEVDYGAIRPPVFEH